MKNITINFILARTTSNYDSIHTTGVYKIYHISKPDILYIGSASSQKKWRIGFKQRWVEHIKNLKNNVHHSVFLQRVVNKYGLDGLRFEIIEQCLPEQCLEIEQKWLDHFKPFSNKGYNTCEIAGSSLGYKFPEEKKKNTKPINQYDIEGNFIKEWPSLNEASRELKINVSSIKDCCKKRYKQIKRYIFRYLGDDELPEINTINIPMIIECFYNNQIVYSGKFSEIIDLVPDKKAAVYKSIKDGTFTKKKWKYNKKLN